MSRASIYNDANFLLAKIEILLFNVYMIVAMFWLSVWNCAAERTGNVGVVYYASSNDSLTTLIQNGTHQPYIVVMDAQLFELYVYN